MNKKYFIIIAILLSIISLPFCYYIGGNVYRSVYQTSFGNSTIVVDKNLSENQKGNILFNSLIKQLQFELDEGWLVNDIFLSPTSPRYADNVPSRESGVIYAVRTFLPYFSNNFAKYGNADKENVYLKEARTRYFILDETDYFPFGIFPNAENYYQNGIESIKDYQYGLLNNKNGYQYNVTTGDLYNLLVLISGKECLDQMIGILNEDPYKVGFFKADNDIFYVQGFILVMRDILYIMSELYPSILAKGGKENFQVAMKYMNYICKFDPKLVTCSDIIFVSDNKKDNVVKSAQSLVTDHRNVMIQWLVEIDNRIQDIAESVRR